MNEYWIQLGRYLDCDNNLILKTHWGNWCDLTENAIFVLGLGYV